MRKILLTTTIAITLFSCNTERASFETVETLKSTEMKNFDNALKEIATPRYRVYDKKNDPQINEVSKRYLANAARQLLKSEGMTLDEINAQTDGKEEKIINLATSVYFKNIRNYKNIIQSEN